MKLSAVIEEYPISKPHLPHESCTYSRSMDQTYPRKCTVCGKLEEVENPCAGVPITEGVMLDIPWKGEYIRFTNLTSKQSACIIQMYEAIIQGTPRRSTLI